MCMYKCVCVCVSHATVCEEHWKCLLKFLMHRPFELERLLLGIYTIHTHFQVSHSRGMFMAALFFIMKNLEPSKCSLTGAWLGKL